MLISEFARITGLSRETVHFYVRLGLFHPKTTQKGGRHPYLFFGQEDSRSAELIRVGQALGLSLKEIAGLMEKRRKGTLSRAQRVELMKAQLTDLDAKAAGLDRLRAYVRAKIDWQEKGEKGPEPRLEDVEPRGHGPRTSRGL
jgi:MerR family copper efflux transcriptional regulator